MPPCSKYIFPLSYYVMYSTTIQPSAKMVVARNLKYRSNMTDMVKIFIVEAIHQYPYDFFQLNISTLYKITLVLVHPKVVH